MNKKNCAYYLLLTWIDIVFTFRQIVLKCRLVRVGKQWFFNCLRKKEINNKILA